MALGPVKHAAMLAAGVGSRISPRHRGPKVLLELGGMSLLERHLRSLADAGVEELVLVLGHQADAVEAALAASSSRLRVRTVRNHRYREGSVVSLSVALGACPGGQAVLLMDADVLYHRDILLRALHPGGAADRLLVDRELEQGDEPVKVCIRAGRPVEFRKIPDPAIRYDWAGESVGFFRLSPGAVEGLRHAAAHYPETGRADLPYEDVIRDRVLARETAFGFEDITGIPWIEIDFPEDIERARAQILPRL